MNRREFLCSSTGVALALHVPSLARAQTPPWPTARPITYVVPFFAGSTADVVSRVITQKLSESLGQSFVVDNRTGQGGAIGVAMVAKAAPDGYTLVGGTSGTHAANVTLYPNLTYDPIRDFDPVALIGTIPSVLVVGSKLGVNSIAELVALLKKDEKMRNFGSAGAGTSPHLAGELFAEAIGVPLTHVPYRGGPGLTDIISGQLTFKFDQLNSTLPMAREGRIRILAVSSAKRLPQLPDVPTMIEAGVPGFDIDTWHAVFAPKGTPAPIVERLSAEITKAINAPDAKAKLSELGMVVTGGSPADVSALIKRDVPRLAEIIRKSGAKAE